MTDEEKEAIKVLNNFNPTDCGIEDTQAIETILNLIDKQQKEIEELKKNYIKKDKIKAKVIEVKDRPVPDEFITATQGKLNTIIDIESLLDEEE